MVSEDLSWDCGPANSRFVRLLFYPSIGIAGGLMLGFVGLFGVPFLSQFSSGLTPWLLLGLVIVAVYFGPILWASVRTSRVQRQRFRLAREWYDVALSVPSFLAVLLVGGLLVGAGIRFDWSFETYLAVSFASILVGQALGVLAGFFGSAGEVDAENLTLSYAEHDDVDLRRLRDAKRLTLGRHTVLWLLVSHSEGRSGTERASRTGGSGQDLYALPTEVVERAWPIFEQEMAPEATARASEDEKGVLLRRINVFVGLVLAAGGVGVLAFSAWFGAPEWQLLQWLWILSAGGYFFLRFLARTY